MSGKNHTAFPLAYTDIKVNECVYFLYSKKLSTTQNINMCQKRNHTAFPLVYSDIWEYMLIFYFQK